MAEMNDLQRFLSAQENDYEIALRELTEGKKRSHWIWYIFPQLRGLGRSGMAQFYGITDIDEAKAYLKNPLLNERLMACCKALLLHKNKSAFQIMGDIDSIKLKSSMTLFALASEEENSIFQRVLQEFYDGEIDGKTLDILMLSYGK